MSEPAPGRASETRPRVPDYHGMTEDDGFEGFITGLRRSDNPFAPESPLHDAWLDGWIQARKLYGR